MTAISYPTTASLTGRMSGKHAIVTAAAQGIGRAIALRLADEGARVLALDVDAAHLADLLHGNVTTRVIDAADVKQLADSVGDAKVDVLVNCIGWVPQGTLLECSPDDWHRAFHLNVDSLYHAIRLVLPQMRRARSGSIVNIASLAGLRAAPNRAAYATTKAAVVGLTRSVAIDYASSPSDLRSASFG